MDASVKIILLLLGIGLVAGGSPSPNPAQCMDALGMESGDIPDSSITASSSANADNLAPSKGRLHFPPGGWEAKPSNHEQWFQVDFGSWTKISAVETQGRDNSPQWVKIYSITYSYDGIFYRTFNKEDGSKKIFTANSDRSTVVKNVLDNPIITRYIRIHPESWMGPISMRAEFLGCKKGFEIPKIECLSPLGMENGKIPDSAIVASSRYNQYSGPERGRLNEEKEGNFEGGWISPYPIAKQFLQIDLGNVTKVTGIAIQGRAQAEGTRPWWTKTYTLSYSNDGATFTSYKKNGEEEPKVLQGNDFTNYKTAVGRILEPPIIARFIKIIVKTGNGMPSLRVELYGCTDGFPTPKPPQCMEALGMESGDIPDSAITASSTATSLDKSVGRLHFLTGNGKFGGWIAKVRNLNQWFQVDFGRWTKISAVETQGRPDYDYWVKTYSLSYSDYGVIYQTFKNEDGSTKVFTANIDRYTVVKNVLDKPIITRYIRIHPVSWNGIIAMRTEFVGCRKVNGGYSAWGPYGDCSKSCGVGTQTQTRTCTNPPPAAGESDCIKVGPSSQSRECNNQNCPIDGGYTDWEDWSECSVSCGEGRRYRHRQCTNPVPQYDGKKCSNIGPSTETEDCHKQGCPVNGGYSAWGPYGNCSKSCGGGAQTRTRTCTNPPPVAGGSDCSKLGPSSQSRECNNQNCPNCDSPMGMQSGQIPNSALKATSQYNARYAPSYGRLNHKSNYIAKYNNKGQWTQVDFGKVAKVTKIGTQGRHDAAQWITKYTVSYSIDGGFFEFQLHKPYDVPRVYYANRDNTNVVINTLDEPILARYIRIHPVEWYGYISFRFELYGCYSGFSTPKPPACMTGLGLENGNIPDSAITASSFYNANYRPDQGRLQQQYESGGYGSWIANEQNNQQWFQVDFGSWTKVARVAIQGRLNAAHWVTKFQLAYSYDGVFFKDYNEDGGQTKQFDGNTDQFTVVSHLLKNPIITRFIRIVPVTWQGLITLRADFYGCKSGFEIPKIECASPLGMENGKIPDSAIVASSRFNQFWGPERGRLNEKTEGSFGGGWISQYRDANQFLQIDLVKVTKVTRIAHQGRYNAGWWTKTYTLSYSNDGAAFTPYKNNEVFQGNTDYTSTVGRILDQPIIARFIKINVKTYTGYPTLRVELYGCMDGFPTPKPILCMEALGMESGDIPDSAVTASSSYNANSFAPSLGRLHFLSAGTRKYGGWAAAANNPNQWFQVDFGSWTKISAVATQGRQDANQWVKTYSLSFSYDGDFYETVDNDYGIKKIFTGNSDRYTVIKNVLDKPVITGYIRIHPETWNWHISMRTEFYGCKKDDEQ